MATSLQPCLPSYCHCLKAKTDCPISEVFGADKTLAAAAIIAGLITVDPSLQIIN